MVLKAIDGEWLTGLCSMIVKGVPAVDTDSVIVCVTQGSGVKRDTDPGRGGLDRQIGGLPRHG